MRYLSVCSGIEAATVAWRPRLGCSHGILQAHGTTSGASHFQVRR
jgi:hypothetical protein